MHNKSRHWPPDSARHISSVGNIDVSREARR
jgi:hypothetical protein